jgi:DNA-binding LacI/PurR family transcriptional regulator
MYSHRRITIRQIADAAGVSIQTVSRVLNDRPDVSPSTRERIKQIIEDYNYQPSPLARGLNQQRSYTIGVVIAGLKFTGPTMTLNGIAEATEELDYTLIVKQLHYLDNHVQPVLNWLLARHIDGIIWAVPEFGQNRDWVEEWLSRIPVPIVFHDMAARPGVSVVYVNNYAGGRIATQHLIQQGFHHIGHITGPLNWWAARQRKQAWQDALSEVVILPEERFWAQGDWSLSSGASAIGQLLGQYPEMDAVFAANDQMAIGMMQTLCDRGIRVPDDLAVVGYDDTPEAAYICPPLTSIRQDFYRYGYTSVSQLVDMIEAYRQNPERVEHKYTVLEPELVIRKSSLAPPGKEVD